MSSIIIFLILLPPLSGLPYNRPKLCTSAQWHPTAVTFINRTDLGTPIRGIFIDSDDQFYAAQSPGNGITVWSLFNSSSDPMVINIQNTSFYSCPFVTEEQDLYFETVQQPGRIIRQSLNSTNNVTVAQFSDECHGLFIDTNNTLYCSMMTQNRVEIKSLNDTSNATVVIRAGVGGYGQSANQLYHPWGIFVDTNFDLYVADAGNNRIQVFQQGNDNVTTIVGPGTHGSNALLYPTDVILDQEANLYIAENHRHRIVRVTPIGFQCIVGCTGTSGSSMDQLNIAYSLRFDSYGNLFVVDEGNGRVQKFLLTSRCRKILLIESDSQLIILCR